MDINCVIRACRLTRAARDARLQDNGAPSALRRPRMRPVCGMVARR